MPSLRIKLALVLAALSLSQLFFGCFFESGEPDHENITVIGKLSDTILDGSPTSSKTVLLFRPILDPNLGVGQARPLETFAPVYIKEGTSFDAGESNGNAASGKVIKYILTQQRFGSWSEKQEFAWNYFLLQANFLFPSAIPDTTGLNLSTKSLYDSIHIKDTHTNYFDSASSPQIIAQISTSTKDAKVGISIKQLHGSDSLVIQNVVTNSPAGRAGLLKGMILLAINDSSVVGDSSLIRFQRFIAGDSGTTVTITVQGKNGATKFAMQLEPVDFPTVLVDSLSPMVGYISVNGFTPKTIGDNSTATEFHNALIATKTFAATILDFRDNRGGSVDIAFAMCDEILPSGTIIIREHQRHFDESVRAPLGTDFVIRASSKGVGEYASTGAKRKYIVLTNGLTASASEIVLTALKEGMGAIQMGTVSYGKGIGQTVRNTPAHGLALVTFLKFTTASGLDYDLKGVVPDYLDTSSNESLLLHATERAEIVLGIKPLAKNSGLTEQKESAERNGKLSQRAAIIEWNRRQGIRHYTDVPEVE